jgi:cytochrome P450
MARVTFVPLMVATTAAAYAFSRQFGIRPLYAIATSWAIVLPLYLIVWLSWIFPFYVSELRHIPTVRGFPLWGQFVDIITEECGVPQRRWHQQYGPIVRYFFPFGAERLSVAQDDALKHMTVRNPYNYPKPVRAKLWMVRILGEGVLLAEGPEHVHQRKALAPGFSIQSIRALMPVFWEKGLRLSKCWQDEVREAGEVTKSLEILDWLNRTTLDIIGKAGFGYDINSLELPNTPIREAYRLIFAFDISSRVLHGIQAFISWSKYIPAKMNRDMRRSRAIIINKATEIIDTKVAEAEQDTGGKDIISLIVKDNRKLQALGEQGLSFETIRDQIMTFLGAGHDTTATGIAWTLHLLATHPEIQSRLREEVKDYFPFLFDANLRHDFDSLADADPDQLPYMHNVCRESLRFIPPIPMTVRQSLADDTLAGYRIPAGTVVYIIANAVNHLPMYWGSTADRFDPDRWDGLPEAWTNNAYMTFLQGPRGCIGRKFAETEMKIILCCLLSMFEFKPDETRPNPEDWKMWRLVLRPKWGVNLDVTTI